MFALLRYSQNAGSTKKCRSMRCSRVVWSSWKRPCWRPRPKWMDPWSYSIWTVCRCSKPGNSHRNLPNALSTGYRIRFRCASKPFTSWINRNSSISFLPYSSHFCVRNCAIEFIFMAPIGNHCTVIYRQSVCHRRMMARRKFREWTETNGMRCCWNANQNSRRLTRMDTTKMAWQRRNNRLTMIRHFGVYFIRNFVHSNITNSMND